jgi:hypothetical protein
MPSTKADFAPSARSTTINAGLLVILALVSVACVQPANFRVPGIGTDWSWISAVSYAVEKGLVFGSDVVFTAGPLSAFYHRMYSRDLAAAIVLLDVLWLAVFTVALWKMFEAKPRGLFFTLSLALLILIAEHLSRDALMLFSVFAAAYLYSTGKAGTLLLSASIVVTAAFCMAKFSMNAIALPALLLVDLLSISRREVPYKTPLFLLCTTGFFVGSGQPLSGLPAFFRASFEVSSGYAAGMSINGSLPELLCWLAMALTVFCVASLTVSPAVENGSLGRRTGAVRLLLLAGYLFVLLKAGFVRHDTHSLIAWSGLFLAIPLLAVTCSGFMKHRLFAGPLLVCFAFLYVPYAKQARWHVVSVADQTVTSIQAMIGFLGNPVQWMDEKELQLKAAQAQIRLQANMPYVSGTVDVIPSRQSEVIATGLNYNPRPTIQEYTAYSRALIERDRIFYRSAEAPGYVLFEPGSIDGRHPASAEGPLWPLLLQRYEPFEHRPDLLVLRKREQPLPDLLKQPTLKHAQLGERILVPATTAPLFVRIDMRYSLLGRLADLLFKPPHVKLEVIYEGGSIEEYRLIPDIAREGSILVPTIRSPTGFLQLFNGAAGNSPRPIAFGVGPARRGAWAYQSAITISFAEIDTDSLVKAGGSLSAFGARSRSGSNTIVHDKAEPAPASP